MSNTLDKIQIGSETGETAAIKINAAIDAIDTLVAAPVIDAAYIKTKYESNPDTNPLTDAEKALIPRIPELDQKVDKIQGKGLSTLDYTQADKDLVATITGKVDKKTGWGLSENNFDGNYKYLVDTSLKHTDANLPVSPANKLATMADVGTGSGGSSTLAGLIDTNVYGVKDGDVLIYEFTTGIWKPGAMSGGGSFDPTKYYTKQETDLVFATKNQVNSIKLTDLNDFQGVPTTDQILQFDGTNWVPSTISNIITKTNGGSF